MQLFGLALFVTVLLWVIWYYVYQHYMNRRWDRYDGYWYVAQLVLGILSVIATALTMIPLMYLWCRLVAVVFSR